MRTRYRSDAAAQVQLGEAIARAHLGEDPLAIAAAKRVIELHGGRRLATALVTRLADVGVEGMADWSDEYDYSKAVHPAWDTAQGAALRDVLADLLLAEPNDEPA